MTRIPRDQWDRPLIIPPGGGKPVAYRRPSTLGKTLDDTSSLEQWGMRLVAQGLAQRADLLAAVARCAPDDKSVLNSLCEAAKEVAGGSKASRLGTARHALLEQHDLGQLLGILLPGEQEVIDTWDALLAQHAIEIVGEYAEVFLVNDVLTTAGTADRLVRGPWGDQLRVLDIKTGGVNSPKYSRLSWASQLACYAGSTQYLVDPSAVVENGGKTQYHPDAHKLIERRPLDIDQAVGYVAHLPADGPARLIEVDLTLGFGAAVLANQVLGLRTEAKRTALKNLGEPVTLDKASEIIEQQVMPVARDLLGELEASLVAATAPTPEVTIRTQLAERITAIRANPEHFADLAAWWPKGIKPWKLSDPPHYEPDELVLIDACVADVEAKWALPFVETFHPAPPVPDTPAAERPAPETKVSDDVIDALRAMHAGLQPDMQRLADQWVAEAKASGNPVGVMTKRTERAAAITRAILRWAEVVGAPEIGDEWVRAALELVVSSAALYHGVTTGAYLGALTLVEANVLADIAETIGRDGLICGYTDDSTPVIHGTALEGLLAPLARAL